MTAKSKSDYMAEYRKRNRDKLLKQQRAYHARNRKKRNAQTAAYRLAHPDICSTATKRWRIKNPAKVKKLWDDWSRKNRQKRLAYFRTYDREHRQKRNENKKLWHRKNPVWAAAHSAVSAALKSGKLIRQNACSKCAKPCKPEAHHHRGYAKEFWLDVIWLCRKCHLLERY